MNADYERALGNLDRALELLPEDATERRARAHVDRGLALARLDRIDEATQALELGLSLDDQSAFAHYTLGVLHRDQRGDREGALRHLRRYRELGGSDERVLAWLAELE